MDFTMIIIFILVVVILYFVVSKLTRASGLTGTLDAKNSHTLTNKELGIVDENQSFVNSSFSIWTYINDWNYNYGKKKMIFQREGLEVFFSPNQNDLIVKMDTYDPADSTKKTVAFECGVLNIPIQKWMNIIVGIHSKTIDIYINGKLVKTCVMSNVPQSLNGSGITLTGNGGFSGYTSKFNYMSELIDPQTAWNIYRKGWSESNILSVNSGYDVDLVITKDGKVVY